MQKKPTTTNPKPFNEKPPHDIMAMMEMHASTLDVMAPMPLVSSDTGQDDEHMIYTIPRLNRNHELERTLQVNDWIDAESIDLWTNTDLTHWVQSYAPEGKVKMISNELPENVIHLLKTTMVKIPIRSVPVLHKVVFEEHRSIAGRLGSVQFIRKHTIPPMETAYNMAKAFFRPEWAEMVLKFNENKVIFDAEKSLKWLEEHPLPHEKYKALKTMLTEEIQTKSVSDIKIHLKIESLLKDEPIRHWEQ